MSLAASAQHLHSPIRVLDQVGCVSLDAPSPQRAQAIPCKSGLEVAFPASLSPYLQCSIYRSSYCELSSGAPPEARDHGDPICARRRRGDLPVEQSSVELSRGPPYRLWPGLPLWPTGLVGNALGWSSTDSSEKRRSPPPVSVDTCTGPAGPARRLYKGRDWSFGIHWTGTPWQIGRAPGVP